jgi:hypothetical protein
MPTIPHVPKRPRPQVRTSYCSVHGNSKFKLKMNSIREATNKLNQASKTKSERRAAARNVQPKGDLSSDGFLLFRVSVGKERKEDRGEARRTATYCTKGQKQAAAV